VKTKNPRKTPATAEQPDLSTVRRVAAGAALRSFSVVSLHAEITEPPEKTAGNHKLASKVSSTASFLEQQTAEVLVTIHVSIHRKESDPPWAMVASTVRLIYSFRDATPSSGELEQFAKINGVFNAWPFLREIVQSTTLRMGIAPVMLPLHRIKPMPQKTPQQVSSKSVPSRPGLPAKG
jgi:preprotein translocase subunit SecB